MKCTREVEAKQRRQSKQQFMTKDLASKGRVFHRLRGQKKGLSSSELKGFFVI